MKLLLYNYVQPDERNSPGGGVSIYLASLLRELRASGHEVYTMSAGDRYDVFSAKPRMGVDTEKQQIVVYNSPVIAPAIHSFRHPDIYFESTLLDQIPTLIQKNLGRFDVFHFHNIEGLTKSFFYRLREINPQSAIIFSAHNYATVCPEVTLWQRYTNTCTDFQDGLACTSCLRRGDERVLRLLLGKVKTKFKEMRNDDSTIKNFLYRLDRKIFGSGPAPNGNGGSADDVDAVNKWAHMAADYKRYRIENVQLISHLFDKTIAVSHRTRDILLGFGASPLSIDVSYIGTRHYEKIATCPKKVPKDSNIHIGYIGYMRKNKGFYYFLNSVERLPKDVLARTEITIAAKFTDVSAVQRMERLRATAKAVNIFDGYTHQNLSSILGPVNLGIVPPLWEDNLPQVAIEFVCHGIPILTSTLGGAQEIAGKKEFTFDVSDPDGLATALISVANGEVDMESFWSTPLNLRSPKQHAEEIQRIYKSVLLLRNAAVADNMNGQHVRREQQA